MKARSLEPLPLLASVASSAQIQTETAYLQQQNLKYMSICAELEFKISELKAMLEARKIEIEKLRVRGIWEGRMGKSIQELRTYQALLEHENSELQQTSPNPLEVQRLTCELQQVRQLQQLYREKLSELQERTLDDPSPKRSPLCCESLLSLHQDLKQQLQTVQQQLASLTKERDYFKDTVVPVLKQTVELFDQHKANLLAEIEEFEGKERTPEFGRSREDPGKTVVVTTPLFKGSPVVSGFPSPKLSPRMGSSSVLQPKASALSLARPVKVYAPSFLRVKRHGVRVKVRRDLAGEGEEDAFADSFPEDNELEPAE